MHSFPVTETQHGLKIYTEEGFPVSPRSVEERASQHLIRLCGELYDQDAAQLQLKVLRYLEEQTQAECAFLYLVVPETQELFCQVIGKKILQEEERFPGQSSCFSVALETKQPMTLEDIPMESRKAIEEKIECPLRSFLCVPVTSRSNNNLIALTCVANKQNANRFSDRDISCIHQCFRYTSTVLTSTLAFQNERKLKQQTQALLTVARDLFTNLGKCSLTYGKGLENFPVIESRGCEINVYKSFFLAAPSHDFFFGSKTKNDLSEEEFGPLFDGESSFTKLESDAEDLKGTIADDSMVVEKVLGDAAELTETIAELGVKIKEVVDVINVIEMENMENIRKDTTLMEKNTDEMINAFVAQEELDENETDESTEMLVTDLEALNSDYSNDDSTKTINGEDNLVQSSAESITDLDSFETKDEERSADDVVSYDEDDLIASIEKLKASFKEDTKKFHESLKSETVFTEGIVSPDDCFSESDLSFATAFSDYADNDSNFSDRTFDDVYVDSVQSFCPGVHDKDAGDFVQFRPDILGFPEDVFEKGVNRCKSEPLHVGEISPIMVDSKADLNDAFHVEDLDDTINTLSDYCEKDLSDLDKLFATESNSSENINESINTISNQENPLSDLSDNIENGDNEFQEGTILDESSEKGDNVIRKNLNFEKHQSESEEEAKEAMICVSDANIADIQVPVTEAGSISSNDLTKLLREIMQQARNLTHAERCSVFLIDQDTDELVAKVFDGITTKKDNEVSRCLVQEEIRMPITQGIAGKVATSGELLNIKDAYSHPLFYRGIDDSTGFRTRNILCFPIKDEKGRILGVAQLCNKQNCPCFTTFDEEIATAFGIYCCISISHSLMYKKVIDSQVRNSLANELMMYHMKSLMYKKLLDTQHRKSLANELMIYHMQVSPDDVHGLATVDIPHPRMLHANFIEFSYAPRSLLEDKTLLACLSMFEDLNLISRWRIRRETIARFVLMVKKGYRNPPYHNWMHAYTVAQFCYQLIKNLKLENTLDDIELFSLFVSCLCHDIDHRGTNNSFQTASKSVLAALYSSEGSVLERHHFAQTMCILNTEGCNVFENLNSKDYQHVLDLMREIILATDLAHHFKILKNLKDLAERGIDKTSVKERKLLLCLLMTSCDLSDQTRPWENTKRVAALIYKEFFSQGDMEKAKGLEPSDMMDRERAQIPALQISFLDHVALPVYVLLGKLFSPAKEVGDRVEENKQHWIKISNLIKLKRGGSQARMTFEEVLAIENEADDETTHLVNGSETMGSKC
ncbi:cGMP-dependent 3',5'-cyclic phosphodiesterase-like [Ruditapes philippinarum]|uniref:cGMP-dependent 3',5'-cyclic phosphodiesterase-like n=2 Tax=Ruditapes philippinarum TaxID=129788 RepID=UPI00295BDF85|nr:cGMP-dependent 3',5'-cyclic phosphodiesterase-like [Ruditapes philippinarum]